MTKISDLHRRWSKDADYKDPYDALGEEFDLAQALIAARTAAGLSQSQLARRMKTSQSYIARIEGGAVRPSTDALERFAQATRTRLRIVCPLMQPCRECKPRLHSVSQIEPSRV